MEKETKKIVYILDSLDNEKRYYNLVGTEQLAEGIDSFRIFTKWDGLCKTINPEEHNIPPNSVFLVHTMLAPYNYINFNKASLIYSTARGWRIYEVP